MVKMEDSSNKGDNAADICFYTGFPSYFVFEQCLGLLDVGVMGENIIQYGNENGESNEGKVDVTNQRHKIKLSPENQFFLLKIRLRLGLF